MIGRLLCLIKRSHLWRKARVGENKDLKYCARCPESVAVKHRKPKEQTT